jgi:hypothetical protein
VQASLLLEDEIVIIRLPVIVPSASIGEMSMVSVSVPLQVAVPVRTAVTETTNDANSTSTICIITCWYCRNMAGHGTITSIGGAVKTATESRIDCYYLRKNTRYLYYQHASVAVPCICIGSTQHPPTNAPEVFIYVMVPITVVRCYWC